MEEAIIGSIDRAGGDHRWRSSHSDTLSPVGRVLEVAIGLVHRGGGDWASRRRSSLSLSPVGKMLEVAALFD
jgi:hypothetical protein